MNLEATERGWHANFSDGTVGLIQVDFRLGLLLSDVDDSAQLYIETPFRLVTNGREHALRPQNAETLSPILGLFGAKVSSIYAYKSGQFKMEFGDGGYLEVDPDDAYEAWQLACPGKFMLACSPGGSVSLFVEEKS
ncbi:MAG: DUF6188 family protein [Terricaulis sp.]